MSDGMGQFKYRRGIRLSYERQGYIFFLCRRFSALAPEQRDAIRALCRSAGGQYERALLRYLTTSAGMQRVCSEEHIGTATLWRCVKRFYESFTL